jgi:sulfite reductase (ferredoxin)
MSAGKTWKQELAAVTSDALTREIDVYELDLELARQGKVAERVFAETRLRRGAYGQRYDNGQRHDGRATRTLDLPSPELTKGPNTLWHAPGMQRIKVPFGRLDADQLETLAELSEEYSDSILHVTTRQDIQLHFVHIDDTPDLMRRLAAVAITTREACGNSVRNVTACPYAGVCSGETFDVTPYANGLAQFLLGHEDTQEMGRKFKISFSGCKHEACGLTSFHDIGCIARTRPTAQGGVERGFEFYVGGGLGAVPQAAQLFDEFLPEAELLPTAQAICRVFARLGEKENRARARMKFLVKKLGIVEFRRLVAKERRALSPDPRWTAFLDAAHAADNVGADSGAPAAGVETEAYRTWHRTNVRSQRQSGFCTAKVTLPLGDFTPDQARALAEILRSYSPEALRTTVDQNLLLRFIAERDLRELYADLVAVGLGEPGADTIADVTSCPGTDTCKLGISSSRGLAGELRRQLRVVNEPAARELHVKCSGCFNACGQHHVADIGFLGVSRNVGGRRVPHFQLVVGGQWSDNGASFGLAIGAIPSKNVPQAVERLTHRYVAERAGSESFRAFVSRVGKKEIRAMLEDLMQVPPYEVDPSFYRDWGDPREYTIGDMGTGECAGEVVSFAEFGLAASEREVFEAQVLLDQGSARPAAERALSAMLQAAKTLVRRQAGELGDDPDEIVAKFRSELYDTKLFHDPYAGGKFAHYLFRVHSEGLNGASPDAVHQLIEEAQLFVEAAHQCYARLSASP